MGWIDEAKRLAAATVLVKEKIDDPVVADFRGRVCTRCTKLDRAALKCSLCGCYLKVKVWSKVNRSPARPLGEVTHCPLGKWHDTDIANHYRAADGQPPLPPRHPDDDRFIEAAFASAVAAAKARAAAGSAAAQAPQRSDSGA